MMFEEFASKNDSMDYEQLTAAFEKETDIQIENYGRYREPEGDTYQIGDWKYDIPENLGENEEYGVKVLFNEKTGEKIKLSTTKIWRNSTDHTIPAAKGSFFYIYGYKNDNGTSIEFKYDDEENLAPTSSVVKDENGNTRTIQYDRKDNIDPDLYPYWR